MQNTFAAIEKLVAEWTALQPLALEARKKLDKKFRLEFNYNSNHLEGNTLTYGETELLLLFDDTRGNHTMREYEEMKSHDAAWQMINEWARDKERPLTEQAIKNLNEVILVRPFWKEAQTPDGQPTRRKIKIGDYKQHPNSVRLANGELFAYASPVDTPMLMQELMDWYRSKEEALHPLKLVAILHYRFVRIHPFDDGNGRMARLLMNYILLCNHLPPVIIKSEDKQSYLRVLHIADTGDYEPFINYMGEQLEWSLRLSIKAARGESIEEENDWEKKLSLLKKQNSDEKLTPKTADVLIETIQRNVLPLIDLMFQKLSPFDELFAEKRLLFGSNGRRNFVGNLEEIKNAIVDVSFQYESLIRIGYELDGYKRNGLYTFSVKIEVGWEFDFLKYYFFLDHSDKISAQAKFYSQHFTDTEMDQLANECGKRMLKKIEEHLNET